MSIYSQLFSRVLGCCFSALLLITTWAASGEALASNNPYQLTNQVIEKISQRLRQSGFDQDLSYLNEVIRQELMPFAHIRSLGELLLGKSLFDTLDATQQQRYLHVFSAYFEKYSAQQLIQFASYWWREVDTEQSFERQNLVTVRIPLLQDEQERSSLSLTWQRSSETQPWQLCDILVKGVSAIVAQQPKWSNLLRQSGFDAFLDQLQAEADRPISSWSLIRAIVLN